MNIRFSALQDGELAFSLLFCTFADWIFPGFVDGKFESAKFLPPASSFYHAAEDCLFIVDSEVLSLVDCFLMLFFFTV